jgi:hypothetical protein
VRRGGTLITCAPYTFGDPCFQSKAVEKFGAIRIDPYDWLRDRQDPRVVSYLNAENAYTDLILKPIRPLLDGSRNCWQALR